MGWGRRQRRGHCWGSGWVNHLVGALKLAKLLLVERAGLGAIMTTIAVFIRLPRCKVVVVVVVVGVEGVRLSGGLLASPSACLHGTRRSPRRCLKLRLSGSSGSGAPFLALLDGVGRGFLRGRGGPHPFRLAPKEPVAVPRGRRHLLHRLVGLGDGDGRAFRPCRRSLLLFPCLLLLLLLLLLLFLNGSSTGNNNTIRDLLIRYNHAVITVTTTTTTTTILISVSV
mmetsp:Transcript_560/g.1211  ORF Transcript_560/g.1211 Transcript_560/m.1211 type:complete len:226 (-) Transcript_560:259-936(-)